jgi:hypothetical protein
MPPWCREIEARHADVVGRHARTALACATFAGCRLVEGSKYLEASTAGWPRRCVRIASLLAVTKRRGAFAPRRSTFLPNLTSRQVFIPGLLSRSARGIGKQVCEPTFT